MTVNVQNPRGRVWVRLKLNFTDAVMDERGLPHLVFKVAAALARYADAETGIVDRSQAFLADKVEATVRSLQSAIDLLVQRGYVVKIVPAGPRLGLKYRLGMPARGGDDDALAKPASSKGEPPMAKPASPKGGSLAKSNALFSEATFAPIPVLNPVIDSPVTAATATPPQTTTIGVADDGLLDEIGTAIEAAGGKLAKRRHTLQPIRDLIAGGIPRDLAVAAVAQTASRLKRPLGNLDATFVLEAIRDRAAADGYGSPAPSASPDADAKPADAGPTVAIPGHDTTRWPADSVQRRAARWWNTRRSDDWPEGLGETPDRPDPRRSPEFAAALDAGRAKLAAAVSAWPGNAAAWSVERLGPRPDSLASGLGPDLGVDRVTLRHGAGTVTALALDRHLRTLAACDDHDFVLSYRALPSPFDAEDCTLTLEWQIKALEYRKANV